jgi:hypothetical protein
MYGVGVILWGLSYSSEFADLFLSLLKKWEQFTEFCIIHEIIMEEYFKQFNGLLSDFTNHANIELVIQLLDSLMS